MKATNVISLLAMIASGFMGFFLGQWFFEWLVSTYIGIEILAQLLGFAGGVALAIILSIPGLQSLPEVSQSIISLSGWRLSWFVFSEGPAWRIPFISRFITETTQLITYDFPGLECLSKDDVTVTVDGSVQARLTSINDSLGVETLIKTLRQEYESAVRIAIKSRGIEEIPGLKSFIADKLMNGGKISPDDAAQEVNLTGLKSVVESMGWTIESVKITETRPDQKFLDELEARRAEDVQAGAEAKDTDTLVSSFTKAKNAMKDVPDVDVLAAIQARRGFSKNIHVSGGDSLQRAAAILADGMASRASSSPSSDGGQDQQRPLNPRRRGGK